MDLRNCFWALLLSPFILSRPLNSLLFNRERYSLCHDANISYLLFFPCPYANESPRPKLENNLKPLAIAKKKNLYELLNNYSNNTRYVLF